jgi:hypothetical protein
LLLLLLLKVVVFGADASLERGKSVRRQASKWLQKYRVARGVVPVP